MTINPLIAHKFVCSLPVPPHTSLMYEYLFAANGVFIRGIRPEITAIIPVQLYSSPIRGLTTLEPDISINLPLIPKALILSIWRQSCLAQDLNGQLLEILFHLSVDNNTWILTTPKQTQSPYHCQSVEPYNNALAEIHSHGAGAAYFSRTDNEEENGFRIYAVMGKFDTLNPEILVRIGLFSYFMTISASKVFELPNFIVDVATR